MLAFVKTVELGSFTAAAETLLCKPQAVGKRVRELERYLGARLLERTTRKQILTSLGSDFYPRASSILLKIEEAERLVDDFRQLPLDIG